MHIRAGGDVGYAFALRHMSGRKKSGETADLWFRATATMAKENGDWRSRTSTIPFPLRWTAAARPS